MKRVIRLPLSPEAIRFLEQRTTLIKQSLDPRKEALRLWRNKKNKAFDDIRSKLREMALGLDRCMYCEDSEGATIEHFWPKATYPYLAFLWENYLLACAICNSNSKRNQFPLDADGQPLLIDPTQEDPLLHLAFSPTTGEYEPLSPKGRASIDIYQLQRKNLVLGRLLAWEHLQGLLLLYASRRASGDPKAETIQESLCNYPFAGVLAAFLRLAANREADQLIDAECLKVLQEYPEVFEWHAIPKAESAPSPPR